MSQFITFAINVYQVPPKIMPIQSMTNMLKEGMRAAISCQILEGDLPLTFRWERNGKALLGTGYVCYSYWKKFSNKNRRLFVDLLFYLNWILPQMDFINTPLNGFFFQWRGHSSYWWVFSIVGDRPHFIRAFGQLYVHRFEVKTLYYILHIQHSNINILH